MIRGCKREVYVVKDTKSKIFERVFFVMKKDLPSLSEYTVKQEAEKLIADKAALYKGKSLKVKK